MITSEEFEEFLDDLEDGSAYRVQFALGMPVYMDRVEDWISIAHLEVHARAHEAWVSWISDLDPVSEVDWMTRPSRMVWNDPWLACWQYVDWPIAHKLGQWVMDHRVDRDDEAEDEPSWDVEEDDYDLNP